GQSIGNLQQGHVNPDVTNGLQVIAEGRTLEVGSVALQRPPEGLEAIIPVYSSLRRMGASYAQGDAEGILNNAIFALGDYILLRSACEGANAANESPSSGPRRIGA